MSIFAGVQARHFYLARSTIQCALTSIQQLAAPPPPSPSYASGDPTSSGRDAVSPSSPLLNFASNMVRILRGWGMEAQSPHHQRDIRYTQSIAAFSDLVCDL